MRISDFGFRNADFGFQAKGDGLSEAEVLQVAGCKLQVADGH